MFGLGAKRRKDDAAIPVFNDKDIQRLVDLLPPSEPRTLKEPPGYLLRTFHGNDLIRSTTVRNNLKNILETYDALIPVSNLPRVLNVRNVDSFLDSDDLLYTKDRQHLVPELILQGVLEDLEAQCAANFVDFADFASSRDLRGDDLQDIILRKRKGLTFVDSAGSRELWITSNAHLQEAETRLRKVLQEAQDAAAVTYIDASKFQAPRSVLKYLVDAVLSAEEYLEESDIRLDKNGFHFTPRSALEQEANQVQEQHQVLVQRIVSNVQRDGYCIHTGEAGSGSALVKDVKEHWRQESSPLETLEDQSTICFITAEHLQSVRDALLTEVAEVAERLYNDRDLGTDVVFDPEVLQVLIKSSKTPRLSSILVAKDPQLSSMISSSFAERLSSLQSIVHTAYQNAVRVQLLAPTQLYTTSCGLVSDTSLRAKLTPYTHEYLQKDLLPAAIVSILNPSTIPSKATHAEVLRLQTSIAEASTIEDIETALRRLARRTKVSTSFDGYELQTIKRNILETKIKSMRNMKRDSDVLQNLLWILLATVPFPAPESGPEVEEQQHKEALWISSGKDTTRMIKLYRQIAETVQVEGGQWAAWGEELNNFRDAVKEGKTSDGIKEDMAALAERALTSWLGRGYAGHTKEGGEKVVDT